MPHAFIQKLTLAYANIGIYLHICIYWLILGLPLNPSIRWQCIASFQNLFRYCSVLFQYYSIPELVTPCTVWRFFALLFIFSLFIFFFSCKVWPNSFASTMTHQTKLSESTVRDVCRGTSSFQVCKSVLCNG